MAANGGLSRMDSSAFRTLLRGESMSRDPAFALPPLGDTPRAGDDAAAGAFTTGLMRQLSFDPLRTMDFPQSAQPSGAPPAAPVAPRERSRRGGHHAHGEDVSAAARSLHAVRGHTSFKPERGVKASAADVSLSEMKHADHRRLLSRWGKALFRFAGIKRDDFARRTGSYRENFLHVLTVCFGSTFDGPGSWWYDHSHAGAFASALLYCATSGRVRVDESETTAMFTKKEPERAASSWIVNEAQLLAWGVAPSELAALFRGEARRENGFPRGVPLIVPAPHELPPPQPNNGVAPSPALAAGAAVLAAAGGWRLPVPPPPPPQLVSGGGSGSFFLPSSLPPSRGGSDAAFGGVLQQAPGMPMLPFGSTPLARQNTIATLAILMCQSEHIERASGQPLDRTFSDGARALMAAMAAGGSLPADTAPRAEAAVQLGSAAPAWARSAAQ